MEIKDDVKNLVSEMMNEEVSNNKFFSEYAPIDVSVVVSVAHIDGRQPDSSLIFG